MTTDFDAYERRLWADRAAIYENTVGKLCAYPASALLDAAGVTAGTRMLDAGTGSGTVAALACARGATVTAVDAESSMVESARRNVPSAEVVRGILPNLPFDEESFDAITANFVINHVGDPRGAVSELRRLARPAARVAVTIWPYPLSPLHAVWEEVLDAADAHPHAAFPKVNPELDFGRTEAGLGGLLRECGLADVKSDVVAWTHRVDPEVWWSGPANGIATIGAIITSQSPDTVERIKTEYDRIVARYRTADGLLALPTSAVLASGRA